MDDGFTDILIILSGCIRRISPTKADALVVWKLCVARLSRGHSGECLDISSNSGGCFSYTALIKQHTENISVELPQNPKQF